MNEQIFSIIDAIIAPIFILEPDEANLPVYAAFNREACLAANLSPVDVIGKTARELYPGRLGELAYHKHCEALKTGSALTYEITLPIAGRFAQIRTHLNPVLNCDGRIQYLVGTSEDISREKSAREAQANIQTLNTEIEQFVSLAAHDLRSPIKNVTYLANLLREGFQDLGDGKLMIIDMLESVASKATLLISDVLDHAKVTGTTEMIATFEPNSLCQEILIMLDPTERHTINTCSGWVTADQAATQIVLRNLISNSMEHNVPMPVHISFTFADAREGFIDIIMRDQSTESVKAAKELLIDLEDERGNSFGVHGLKRLVRARKGQISVEQEGDMAITRVTLPGKVLCADGRKSA